MSRQKATVMIEVSEPYEVFNLREIALSPKSDVLCECLRHGYPLCNLGFELKWEFAFRH